MALVVGMFMLYVLRMGHRIKRDERLTTHVCLAARAFNADGIILSGERDEKLMDGVKIVSRKWGGMFAVKYEKDWKGVIRNFKGDRIHLTMYGEELSKAIPVIRKSRKDLLVIVGAGKVPRDVYDLVEWNVGVGSQPHSEVSALAIFLHEYFGGKELGRMFKGAKLRITPSRKGKCVVLCKE